MACNTIQNFKHCKAVKTAVRAHPLRAAVWVAPQDRAAAARGQAQRCNTAVVRDTQHAGCPGRPGARRAEQQPTHGACMRHVGWVVGRQSDTIFNMSAMLVALYERGPYANHAHGNAELGIRRISERPNPEGWAVQTLTRGVGYTQ